MGKIKVNFLAFMTLILILSGCTLKQTSELIISEDKTVKMKLTYLLDEELQQMILADEEGNMLSDEELLSMYGDASGEATVDVKKEGDLRGLEITSMAYDIDTLTGEAQERVEINTFSEDSIIFVKNEKNYVSNFYVAYTGETESYESMDSYEYKLIITLPQEPISHNATEVGEDGKTLIWDLSNQTEDLNIDFEFRFEKYSLEEFLPWILGGLGALILLIVVFIFLRNKKKKKAAKNNEAQADAFLNKSEDAVGNTFNETREEVSAAVKNEFDLLKDEVSEEIQKETETSDENPNA